MARQTKQADTSALVTAAALASVVSSIPQPAANPPPDTTSDLQVKGSTPRYALEDHTHPTRVQRAIGVLDASGLYKWMFATPFASEPNCPNPAYRENTDNLPVIVRVKDFVREKNAAGTVVAGGVLEADGGTGNYIGVLYKGVRLNNGVVPTGVTVVGINVLSAIAINIVSSSAPSGLKIYAQAAPNT